MATTNDSHFRITVWPGDPVPEPPILNFTVTLQGHWLLCDLSSSGSHAVPFDAYLHEIADADPSDPESLRLLVEQLGIFTTYGFPYRDLPVHDKSGWTRELYLEQQRTGWRLSDVEADRERLMAETECIPIHLTEVSLRVRVLQQLGRHVVAHAAGESVSKVWPVRASEAVEAFRGLAERLGKPDWQELAAERAAWHVFMKWLNAGISSFQPRVFFDNGQSPVGVTPNAYEVACLQILNHLNIGATYNHCANSTCGRPFVRQRGRSEHYTRTEGVRYCSRPCANQQTQRDYRLRQKAGKR